jgi:hypothetical protein
LELGWKKMRLRRSNEATTTPTVSGNHTSMVEEPINARKTKKKTSGSNCGSLAVDDTTVEIEETGK